MGILSLILKSGKELRATGKVAKEIKLGAEGIKGAKASEEISKLIKKTKGIGQIIKTEKIPKSVKTAGKILAVSGGLAGGSYLVGKGITSAGMGLSNVYSRFKGEPWTYKGQIVTSGGTYSPETNTFTPFDNYVIGEGGEDIYRDAFQDGKTGTKVPWTTIAIVGLIGYGAYRLFKGRKKIKLQSPITIKTSPSLNKFKLHQG